MNICLKPICYLLISALTLFSCTKDDKDDKDNSNNNNTNNPTNTTTSGEFKTKLDGVEWKSIKSSARIEQGRIAISGRNADDDLIVITLDGETTGTYQLKETGVSGAVYTLKNAITSSITNLDSTVGGTVIITEIDQVNKTISGTFSFKAKHTLNGTIYTFTEGIINKVPFTTSGGGNPSSSLSVKVDGAPWTPELISGVVNFGTLNLVGSTGARSVGLNMPESVTAGTYKIETLGDPYYAQYNINATTFLSSDSGSLEIISHDKINKKIVGKFSFKASQLAGSAKANLTEGNFDITY